MGKAVVIAVLGLAGTTVVTPAHADPVAPVGTGTNQEIRNQQNTLCLDDYDWQTSSGAEVRQWTCVEGANQLWSVTDLGNGYAEIKNNYSNLCLDDYQHATAPGSEVRQWACHREPNQQWQLTDVGGGWTEIRSRYNNLCLQSSASPADGVGLTQEVCNNSGTQRWRLTDPNVAKVTYTLWRSDNPSADEIDAYARITDAMDRALARYNKFGNMQRHLSVEYAPGVQTADANINGHIRFGSNRGYMQEGVALHEVAHTFGVGTEWFWQEKCVNEDWPAALPLVRYWDGPDQRVHCGSGHHFAPYGLNYPNEYNELAFDRHVRLVQAMKNDGL